MTTYDNEGGSQGAAATTANTGASSVSAGVTFDSAYAIAGSFGLRFPSSTTLPIMAEYTSYTAGRLQSVRWGFTMPTTAFLADVTIAQLYGSTDGTTTIGRLILQANNQLRFSDIGTAHSGVVQTDMTAYLGTKIAIGMVWDPGTTSTDGSMKIRVWADPLAAASAFIGTEFSVTNYNLGSVTGTTNNILKFRFGMCSVHSAARVVGCDNLTTAAGSTTFLDGPAASTAPTASAGTPQYALAGSTVTLHSEASTAGSGSITGRVWTCTEFPAGGASPSISTPTSTSPTVQLTSPGHYTFHVVVTQSGGSLTAAADVTEYVYPSSGVDVPVYSTAATNFTNEGGSANLAAAMNDLSTATFAMSPANPVGEVFTAVMCPFGPGSIVVMVEGYYAVALVNRVVNIYKEDGVTLLFGPVAYALASSAAERVITLDATALAAIPALADRRMLMVKITDTAA